MQTNPAIIRQAEANKRLEIDAHIHVFLLGLEEAAGDDAAIQQAKRDLQVFAHNAPLTVIEALRSEYPEVAVLLETNRFARIH